MAMHFRRSNGDRRSLMRRILIVAGFASLVSGEAAATPQCPSEVEVAQQLTVSLPDWTVLRDPVPHRLNRLAFFDGPPEEQASLTPDVSRKVKDRTVSTWRFGAASDRRIWITCGYAGTSVWLVRELQPGTRRCSVTYYSRVRFAGRPSIEKLDCE